MTRGLSRRTLLAGALGGAAALSVGSGTIGGGTAWARPARAPHVLVATNEPWGTYHVAPMITAIRERGWEITQLVPDRSQLKPGDPVPAATLDEVPPADLLVINGAADWPADVAEALPTLPLVASSLAYLNPVEAPRAAELRRRLRVITSSSPAESRAFARYLGSPRRIRVVGSPQTDALPPRAPEPDLVLVLTSVTYPDQTGGAAPGTQLLLDAAERLQAAGKRILVGLHPRENPALWSRYEISTVPSLQASGRAEAAIGIPGTVFPLIAAAGVPVIGCVDPALVVPDYLLRVCSATITDPADAVESIMNAELPDADVLYDAVGPVGGSVDRLLDAWAQAARRTRNDAAA